MLTALCLSLQDEHFIETKELKEKFSSKMTGVEKGFVVMMDGHVAEMYQLKRSVDEKLMMVLNAQSPQQQQQLSNPGPLLPLPRPPLIGPHNGYLRPLPVPYGIYQQGPRPPYSAAGQVPFPFCLN